ncbi:hypothetical protein P7K49_013194 [Saguinus oedipus]|uniref:Uncharacterized protein n=1 Tax=Saguinus oedipus TaxID=9490 RepID=A0ABQ9VF82_SAGOE|nr:hypothetical protein P7K49_013194 [Saguinus oedipus]
MPLEAPVLGVLVPLHRGRCWGLPPQPLSQCLLLGAGALPLCLSATSSGRPMGHSGLRAGDAADKRHPSETFIGGPEECGGRSSWGGRAEAGGEPSLPGRSLQPDAPASAARAVQRRLSKAAISVPPPHPP